MERILKTTSNICSKQSNQRRQLHKRRRIIEGNQPIWVEGDELGEDEWVMWRLLLAPGFR